MLEPLKLAAWEGTEEAHTTAVTNWIWMLERSLSNHGKISHFASGRKKRVIKQVCAEDGPRAVVNVTSQRFHTSAEERY